MPELINNPDTTEPKTYSEEYVKELRQEAAANRIKLKEQEAQHKKQMDELRQQFNKKAIAQEIKSTVVQMGLVDADAVMALLDTSNITVNDDGVVTGINEAITQLVSNKPWLKGTASTIGTPSNPVVNDDTPKVFTRQQVAKMSPADINKNWGTISQLMAAGKL